MRARPLSDLDVRRARAPDNGRVELADGMVPGLKVRITPNSRKTWSLQVNINGRKRRFTIGEYPAVGLAEARKRAQRVRADALDGRDPIKEKREELQAREADARTVFDAIDEYADVQLKPNLRTAAERERQLRAALSDHAGSPVSRLSKHDLQATVDQKARDGARIAANRIRAALIAFAKWCWQRGYIAENIGLGTSPATKEQPRDRLLTVVDVRRILEASHQMGPLWGPFVRLLVLTGQRRGDVAGMRWSEVDLDRQLWSIPAARTKNRRTHKVHLSAPATAELEALQERAILDCDFVLTTTGKTPISGFGRAKERLDKMVDLPDWRFHDLRTAFASALCDRGEPENVVDRVLNHAASGSAPSAVARVYNQAELLEQRARALDLWAEMLAEGNVRYEHLTI
jgi:integrase